MPFALVVLIMLRRAMLVIFSVLLGAALFGAGTAFGTTGHESKTVTELTKLEDLKGLPCGEGTQFGPGRTDFRIFRPENASVIQWACVTDQTRNFPDQADIPVEDPPLIDITPTPRPDPFPGPPTRD